MNRCAVLACFAVAGCAALDTGDAVQCCNRFGFDAQPVLGDHAIDCGVFNGFSPKPRGDASQRALKCARGMCRSLFTETDSLSPLANPYLSIRLRVRQLRFYLEIRERYRDRIKHVVEILKV